MIEELVKKLIEELGATGLLVCGLYLILYKPLSAIAQHVRTINHELGKLVFFITNETTDDKDKKNKD